MPTYLLTWNPIRKHGWEELQSILEYGTTDWSCGTRKSMPVGSRVFLLKQGPEPRGIVASGTTLTPVRSKRHWDSARASKGAMQNSVDVRFDTVLGPDPDDVLHVTALARGPLKSVAWNTRASGIMIADSAAVALERLWKHFVGGQAIQVTRIGLQAIENTLTEVHRYSRKRDRSLRQQALIEARGYCATCGTNYGQFLGGLGMRVLQVHHRRQLGASDAPRITRVQDLAVVCANCHSLIHSNPRKSMPIEKLRRLLARAPV